MVVEAAAEEVEEEEEVDSVARSGNLLGEYGKGICISLVNFLRIFFLLKITGLFHS